MNPLVHRAIAAVGGVLMSGIVTAPSASSQGVRESTDPARARAVERAAAELRQRAPTAPAAARLQGGDNSAGHRFLSGGITGEERAAMLAERGRYTLWVTTVARPSGAYLADVRLLIRSAAGAVIFERVMDGPWLFVTLPAGRYQIEGTLHEPGAAAQTLRVTVSVPAQGQRQAVLRFASDAEVAPDDSGAAKFNPFEGAPGSVPR